MRTGNISNSDAVKIYEAVAAADVQSIKSLSSSERRIVKAALEKMVSGSKDAQMIQETKNAKVSDILNKLTKAHEDGKTGFLKGAKNKILQILHIRPSVASLIEKREKIIDKRYAHQGLKQQLGASQGSELKRNLIKEKIAAEKELKSKQAELKQLKSNSFQGDWIKELKKDSISKLHSDIKGLQQTISENEKSLKYSRGVETKLRKQVKSGESKLIHTSLKDFAPETKRLSRIINRISEVEKRIEAATGDKDRIKDIDLPAFRERKNALKAQLREEKKDKIKNNDFIKNQYSKSLNEINIEIHRYNTVLKNVDRILKTNKNLLSKLTKEKVNEENRLTAASKKNTTKPEGKPEGKLPHGVYGTLKVAPNSLRRQSH